MKNKKIITIWARVLLQVLDGQSEAERKKTLERVRVVLTQKKKDYLLPKILETVIDGFQKRDRLQLIFARDQDAQTVEKIKRKLDSIGKEKTTVTQIDEAIIGGFVAKTQDYIVNASIKDYLDQLKRQYVS